MTKKKVQTMHVRAHPAVSLLTIIIVGFAIYSNVIRGEFVSDDYSYIVNNPAVKNAADFKSIWDSYNTRFLVGLSYAMNYRLGRWDTLGYHLWNISCHILAAIEVYFFILLIFRTPVMKSQQFAVHAQPVAFFASLLFLCHPLQTQGVAYIMQRAVSMATVFYLAVLICYLQARLKRHKGYEVAAWAAFVLALITKEMTMTLPLTLILVEFFFFGPWGTETFQRLKRLVPFACIGSLFFFLMAQARPEGATQVRFLVSFKNFDWNYVVTEMNVLRAYLRLVIFPVGQNYAYDFPIARGLTEWSSWFSISILSLLLWWAVYSYRRARLVSFCICWFFITTSVEAVSVVFGNRNVMYEHWMYLPMVGCALLVAVLLMMFLQVGRCWLTVTSIILILCCLTYQRNQVWQTEIGLWQDVIKKSPQYPWNYLSLGVAYQNRGLITLALSQYQKALELHFHGVRRPHKFDQVYLSRVYNNLGVTHYLLAEDDMAVQYLEKALSVNPQNGGAYHNLGLTYYQLHQPHQALQAFEQSLQFKGDNPEAYRYMGMSALILEQSDKAGLYFRKAIELYKKYGELEKLKEMKDRIMNL